jgi:hypothetical protein
MKLDNKQIKQAQDSMDSTSLVVSCIGLDNATAHEFLLSKRDVSLKVAKYTHDFINKFCGEVK